ncbi:MAG TPA: TolC family protein [Candidatus Deferrimicrobiaceae bacterium]|nr:TolC family protein [Candidatus Deferrimicrobiaceae bacterium]
MNLNAGFAEVGAAVEERAATTIVWNRGAELDREAAERLRVLLGKKFTADDAVQIAMLNNRDLQAIYADLGLAQADLVQAGLFRNPVLDAAVLFPLSGVRPDLQLGVVVSFLDALYVPLRKRVAAARFEDAKLRVTGVVVDLAAQVRRAFYEHQANEQMRELRQTVVQALAASWDVSRRLHEAGNVTDLDLARDRAVAETAKLALRSAETAARQSREHLNELMGTWGKQTGWEIDGRLPDIPAEPLPVNGVERVALSRSIDLSQARQRIVIAGQQLGYDRATALIPETEVGVEAEREEGWKVGPVLSVPIPLFDQGQARVGRAMAELRRAQQEYYALAVRIRATARAVRDRMLGARDRALYYRDILLPLQERIVNEAQLQYNAMQIGIFQLLRDRERQIDTGAAYVQVLREYWLARTDLALISSGRLPTSNGSRVGTTVEKGRSKEGVNGH